MEAIGIREAKTHLSRRVEEASRGKAFIIAKAAKPMVKVIPYTDDRGSTARRLGFMQGEIRVPDNFDAMGGEEIAGLFDGPQT